MTENPRPEPDATRTILVRRARLDLLPASDTDLSPDERTRAARLLDPGRRRRFIAARAFLRRELAAYLGEGRSPASLRFAYGPLGKPELVAGGAAFNLAHSDDLVALALARGGRLGIDLEVDRRRHDLAALARRFLGVEERAQLADLDPDDHDRAVLRIWTRKEAVLKALGSGVFAGFDLFAVSASSPPRFLRRPEDPAWAGLLLDELPQPGGVLSLCHDAPAAIRLEDVGPESRQV
ncbi:MAG: 4'-phosphopantetheinyl transferase superfamily protein [Planctomycetes bacterium]|nr:4'-phosphopantetheinyl transferase superfamily protein [Planctomycetota bacterium]